MRVEVALVKAGQTIEAEILDRPIDVEVTDAIIRVCGQARQKIDGPLWPFQVVVREVV